MARSLMFLFFAGASISLLALFVGHAPADEPRMIGTAASGFGIALVLLVGYDRLPSWTFPLFLACGTMLIEWTIYSSGESTSAFAMFYFWIAIYAFYFFSRRMAVMQLLFIACSYGAVLALIPNAPNPSALGRAPGGPGHRRRPPAGRPRAGRDRSLRLRPRGVRARRGHARRGPGGRRPGDRRPGGRGGRRCGLVPGARLDARGAAPRRGPGR